MKSYAVVLVENFISARTTVMVYRRVLQLPLMSVLRRRLG